MRWLLVRILRWRHRLLCRHEARLMEVIEKYGGITQVHLTAEWRERLREVQKRRQDVEARLHRAGG